MRIGWAIVAGLVLGGGLGWWLVREQRPARPAEGAPAPAGESQALGATPDDARGPVLYRWRDANGVLQVSDQPPEGVQAERVDIDPDRNVVPMSGPAPEPGDG